MKKIILLVTLLSIILLVLLDIFNTGNQHITVVDKNIFLNNQNKKLKDENIKLSSENNSLKKQNENLNKEIYKVNSQIFSIEKYKEKKESFLNNLPKTIIKIEKQVESEIGWTTKELAYELLKEKLKRNPTKEEYKITLKNLLDNDMLYEAGNPDPYSKGKKINKEEIENL